MYSILKVINSHTPMIDKLLAALGASVVGLLTLTDIQAWVAVSIGVGTFLALIPRIGIGFVEWNNKIDERRARIKKAISSLDEIHDDVKPIDPDPPKKRPGRPRKKP